MIEIHHVHHSLEILGTLDYEDLPILKGALADKASGDTVHLLLHDMDIAEGRPMAGMTALLKSLLHQGIYLRVDGAPQLLIHNLYRVGYHPHACLQVDNMRQDEAYG